MSDLDPRLQAILDRNARVERDKAWETSLTRRGTIAGMTYLTACVFLWLIGNDNVWLNALVPTGGYLLSTLTLPPLKNLWLQQRKPRS